jgi:hypothetical protein
MLCKVPYGKENPYGAYYENIRKLDGKTVRVEINNFGAAETKVFLPCGHDIGGNCIVPHNFCPRCKVPLNYPDCSHKVPLTAAKMNSKDAARKCIECRVADYEHKENLSGRLARLANLKAKQTLMHKEMRDDQVWDRARVEHAIFCCDSEIKAISDRTNLMLETSEFQLSGYE